MRRLFPMVFVVGAASAAAAQVPLDTSARTVRAANKDSSDSSGQGASWSAGVAAGQLRFSDGAEERAIGATLGTHLFGWLDLSLNPTYAWARGAPTQVAKRTVPGRQVSGFTDLPVDIGISHDLPGDWSPSIGLSLGVNLPTGDSAGVGGGKTTSGLNVSLGFAPSSRTAITLGAGHSLANDYASSLGSSSGTSLSAGITWQVGKGNVNASFTGDIGAASAGYEAARSLAAGVNIPLAGDLALTIDGSGGLTTGAPTWTYSVGLGTSTAALTSATVAPYKRLQRVFGTGRTSRVKPKTKGKG